LKQQHRVTARSKTDQVELKCFMDTKEEKVCANKHYLSSNKENKT